MVHSGARYMRVERFDESIKTRVPRAVKEAFEAEAARRHVDLADVVREAFREWIDRQLAQRRQPELELNGKEAA